MPISDCEVRDPRIRRTRQLLQGALRTLLEGRSFDEIAVQDIAEAATVNRATFYDHYTDKYALLDAMIAGGFHTLLAERRVQYDAACPSAAGAIVLAACDYLVLTHSGQACQRQSPFEPLIDSAIVRAICRVILDGLRSGESGGFPETTVHLAATTAGWAIYGAVREWFQDPHRPPATEIVPVVLRLTAPALEEAAARGPAASR